MEGTLTVILTGLHSGINPSPGLGSALSLRHAYPQSRLVGLDYSTRSTGLSHTVFDDQFVLPQWSDVDPAHARQAVYELVSRLDAVLVSGLDLEAELLSRVGSEKILVSPPEAFELTAKGTAHRAAEVLGLRYPETIVADDLAAAHRFCTDHGWRAWAKGHRYEAVLVTHPAALVPALSRISNTWGAVPLLQRHVSGVEESICFVAHRGLLLDACAMEKTSTTPEGKTWSGRIGSISNGDLERLTEFVAVTSWTGGGELELVRDGRSGIRFLIDLNPRFPAWIHGATLAGHNLPALLVEAATGYIARRTTIPTSSEFVRVVTELPSRYPSIRVARTDSARLTLDVKGHPSGMPTLSKTIYGKTTRGIARNIHSVDVAMSCLREVQVDMVTETPVRVVLDDEKLRVFNAFAVLQERLSRTTSTSVRCAYSIKTSRQNSFLAEALRSGFLAEAISMAEVRRALDAGFTPSEVVLNGPGKWWPAPPSNGLSLGAVFADSNADLRRCIRMALDGDVSPKTLGIRISPPGIESRFGIRLQDRRQFAETARILGESSATSFSVHMHIAASAIGYVEWERNASHIMELSAALQRTTGMSVAVIDFGGGWPSNGLDEGGIEKTVTGAAARAQELFPSLEKIWIEPGKAMTQSAEALLTRVLEVRDSRKGARSAILDASIAELSDSTQVSRAFAAYTEGAWRQLTDGEDSIYGRICMEQDILRQNIQLPSTLSSGDLIAVVNAGAYESSMSYDFGR